MPSQITHMGKNTIYSIICQTCNEIFETDNGMLISGFVYEHHHDIPHDFADKILPWSFKCQYCECGFGSNNGKSVADFFQEHECKKMQQLRAEKDDEEQVREETAEIISDYKTRY